MDSKFVQQLADPLSADEADFSLDRVSAGLKPYLEGISGLAQERVIALVSGFHNIIEKERKIHRPKRRSVVESFIRPRAKWNDGTAPVYFLLKYLLFDLALVCSPSSGPPWLEELRETIERERLFPLWKQERDWVDARRLVQMFTKLASAPTVESCRELIRGLELPLTAQRSLTQKLFTDVVVVRLFSTPKQRESWERKKGRAAPEYPRWDGLGQSLFDIIKPWTEPRNGQSTCEVAKKQRTAHL